MEEKRMHIALAGNPNCGKTTLFNALTGSNGYVGNWPGVTVEKKEAVWKGDKDVTLTDLPGIYSLSPYSPEEVVSRDYLVKNRPSAVIDLVDVTNLERNLYLTTQVLECGLPVVLGLNMCDLLEKSGDKVDTDALERELGVKVVKVSALKNKNTEELVKVAAEAGRAGKPAVPVHTFGDDVEAALDTIADAIKGSCVPELVRWYSIKVFERDAQAIEPLHLSEGVLAKLEPAIEAVEKERDDDSESIITSDRYEWIARVIDTCVTRAPKKMTTTEKIDRVVTNRVLGLPIFIVTMILVYFISISTVGTAATDWVNDNLFADGFHLAGIGTQEFNDADEAWAENYYSDKISGYIDAAAAAGVSTDGVQEAVDDLLGDQADVDADNATIAQFEKDAQKAKVTATDVPKHDGDGNFIDTEGNVVQTTGEGDDVQPVLADGEQLDVLDKVTLDDFKAALDNPEPDPADYGIFVPSIPTAASDALESVGASPVVQSLIVDGIIAGVGSVLGFVPQMFVLFLFLVFLEDCGYMSRVAFVMDRVFRRFGLSGKSFIPMLVSSGCGVPGVLATKTIENEADRRMTVMTTTMVPCSAKLPIIALLMGNLIGGTDAWWIAPLFYFLGVACVIIASIMLKKTKPFAGETTPFVMELPQYHLPAFKSFCLHVWERIRSFLIKAGTIIFAASVLVWFLSNFGVAGWDGGNGAFGFMPGMEDVPDDFMNYSLLAGVGGAIAWLFAPLGFDNWMCAASTLSALIAKENLVSTFGILYGVGSDASENATTMWTAFGQMFTVNGVMMMGSMFAFVAFNLLCVPCFAAIGTIRRQMNSAKWFWATVAFMCGFAWCIALMINQFYNLIVLGQFGIWTVVAFAVLAFFLFMLFRPMPKYDEDGNKVLKNLAAEN